MTARQLAAAKAECLVELMADWWAALASLMAELTAGKMAYGKAASTAEPRANSMVAVTAASLVDSTAG